MRVTKHAEERLEERAGFSKKTADKMAKLALERGIKHSDTAGSLNRYLTSLYSKHGVADNIRIYGQFVYLFYGDTLITVFQLRNEFRAAANKIARRTEHGCSTETGTEETENQHQERV